MGRFLLNLINNFICKLKKLIKQEFNNFIFKTKIFLIYNKMYIFEKLNENYCIDDIPIKNNDLNA